MEEHDVILGSEFQIHQLEIPKLGSRWVLADSDPDIVYAAGEILDLNPKFGDAAMRKFIFSSLQFGSSYIRLEHVAKNGQVIEVANYIIKVIGDA